MDETHVEAEEDRQLDNRRALVFDRRSGTYKHSGMEFGRPGGIPRTGAHLFHISKGTVTRLVVYFDRDRAFADLGLTPEGGTTDQSE
jgi:hypothetical protein